MKYFLNQYIKYYLVTKLQIIQTNIDVYQKYLHYIGMKNCIFYYKIIINTIRSWSSVRSEECCLYFNTIYKKWCNILSEYECSTTLDEDKRAEALLEINNNMYYKVIKNREEVYTIIKDALDPIDKWKELPHCNINIIFI